MDSRSMDDDGDEQEMLPWRDDAAASVQVCACAIYDFRVNKLNT